MKNKDIDTKILYKFVQKNFGCIPFMRSGKNYQKYYLQVIN